MSGLNRRELLAGMGGFGSIGLSGCLVCASSSSPYDDYLRVSIRDFEETTGGVSGEARIHHRGPNDWSDKEHARDTFYTHYEDVQFIGYNHEGEQVVSLSVGDFDPGTTIQASFEASEWPMIITAIPKDVAYDDPCPNADVGGLLAVYAGYYPNTTKPEWSNKSWGGRDPRKRVVQRLAQFGPGHRWLPYDELNYPDEKSPSDENVRDGKCIQRALEGRDRGGQPDFTLLPHGDDWLTRDEKFAFTLYGDAAISHPQGLTHAHEIPEPIAESIRETEWQIIDGPDFVEQSLSKDEWLDIAGTLEGKEKAAYPSCDQDTTYCENWVYSGRGNCLSGHIVAYYRFDPHDVTESATDQNEETLHWADYSVLVMEYRWNGVS